MTRRTKIGCLVFAGAFVLLVSAVVAGAAYLIYETIEGARLARLGYENIHKQDYESAIANLDRATHYLLTPDQRYWTYLNLGIAYSHTKKRAQAIEVFSKAIALDRSKPDAFDWRSYEFRKNHETEKELADCNEALRLDPNRGSAHLARGHIFFEREQFARAAADFEEAIRIWPNYAQGFIMLGRSFSKQDDLERALASFDAALRLEPWNRHSYEERAELYRKLGDPERAFFDSAQAQHLAPRKPATSTKGRPAPSPGPFSGSEKLDPFRSFTSIAPLPKLEARISPAIAIAYNSLVREAVQAMKEGDYDKAMTALNKALGFELNGRQAASVMINRGICFWYKGEFDESAHAYEEATKLSPDYASAYLFRATSLEDNGDIDGAMKDYAEAIRLDPQDYRAYSFRGRAFFHAADFKNALIDFSKSLEIKPTQDEAYVFRARLYLHQHEPDKAIQDCSSAIEFHPDLYQLYNTRARAYLQTNKFDLASSDVATGASLGTHEEAARHDGLAWVRATAPDPKMRNASEALKEAQRACEMVHWKRWSAIDTLAAAEAEAGNFAKAVEYARRALEGPIPPVYRADVQARLNSYLKHQPFRDSGE